MRPLLLLCILLLCRSIQAQDGDELFGDFIESESTASASNAGGSENPSVSAARITLVGIGTAGAGTYVTLDKWDRWLEREFSRFHVRNDWDTALWVDKLGHAFISGVLAQAYTDAFRWGGMPDRKAEWWGSGMALLVMTYKEVLDGFATNWGFSPGDQMFNMVGAGLPLLQSRVPAMGYVRLKASYWPTDGGRRIFSDHTGQSYWLTFNVRGLSGERLRVLPAWLNLAAGYKTSDPDPVTLAPTAYAFYVGLDLELSGLPINHPAWKVLTRWLRFVHFPAPAIRVVPSPQITWLAY